MIKNLSELLAPHLGNKIIKDAKYTNLTKPGDNYGSLMLRLDLVLFNNDNKKEEELYLVAKTLPESEGFRELFRVQLTYTNEIELYNSFVPMIEKFQEELKVENRIKCFAKCYGTRKNLLENSDKIDDDAVLLLENLITSGFANGERTIGFDYDAAKLILKDIAQLHAVFLAFKIKKPEEFKTKILPYCRDYEFAMSMDKYKPFVSKVVEESEVCRKLTPTLKFWGDNEKTPKREPFATLLHTDLWVNNTLQKYQNGKAIDNKIVDFQGYAYGSPASDVFFFLWTSVEKSVLEKHFDDLLHYYHQEFVNILRDHKCDTTPFSFENFMKEIDLEADYEFSHSLFFYVAIGEGGVITMEPESDEAMIEKASKVSPTFKAKLTYMIEECHRRGWI